MIRSSIRNLNRKNYFRFLAIMLMVTTYLPVLHNNLPPIIRSHHIWTPIWLVSLVIFAPDTLRNKLFLFVIFFFTFLVFILNKTLWVGLYDWHKEHALGELYIFVIAFSLWAYFFGHRDFIGMAQIAKWSLIFIGITALLSIYSSFHDPMYARKLTGGILETDIERFGGGAYGLAGSLLCLFPILIYYYRKNPNRHKFLIIVFTVICFISVVRMQIFANIIVSIIIILFSLAGRKRLRKSIITTIVLFLAFIIIPNQSYSVLLKYLSDLFETNSENYLKITDLSEYLVIGGYEGMTGGRLARYPLLLKSFVANPLLGHFHTNIVTNIQEGAHLYWMNKLTIYGIIGFIPYLAIYYYQIKRNIKYYDSEYTFYYLMSVASIIVLGFFKNLAGRELFYMLFFILPSLYFLPLNISPKQSLIKKRSYYTIRFRNQYI